MVTFDGNVIGFAALGGILLGVATSLNYIVRGKVTGMSGIFYGIISLNKCKYFIKYSLATIKIKYSRWYVLYFSNILSYFRQ